MNIAWAVVFVLIGALVFGFYASRQRPPEPKIQVVKTIVIPFTVPMNRTARAALQEARSGAISDYVIEWNGRPVASIKTGFHAARRRAGLTDVTPHDLRRTAGRWMVEANVPMAEVSQYMGHQSEKITSKIYARFSPDYLRGAAAALEFGLGRSSPTKKASSGRA